MLFARHPEFGYVGTPRLFRRFGVALALVSLALAAGAHGLKFLTPPPASNHPTNVMAPSPAEGLIAAAPPTAETSRDIQSVPAAAEPTIPKPGAIKPPCREDAGELLGGDCTPVRVARPDPAHAKNERPAIATVAIGHRHEPAALAPEPAPPVVAAPPKKAESTVPAKASLSAKPHEKAETTAPAKASPSAKPRLTAPSPAASPAIRRSTIASEPGDARPAKRGDAKATAASMHPRRTTTAMAKPAKSEDTRDSGHRPRQQPSGNRPAGMDAAGNDVLFDRQQKELAAFTKALGIRLPRLRDLAGGMIE